MLPKVYLEVEKKNGKRLQVLASTLNRWKERQFLNLFDDMYHKQCHLQFT